MKGKAILVVVADGGAARFFTQGPGAKLSEHDGFAMMAPRVENSKRDQDHSPRVDASTHSRRARQGSRLSRDGTGEERFLQTIAARIEILMLKFSASEIVILAPTKPLAILRTKLAQTRNDYTLLTEEVAATNEPLAKINRQVRELQRRAAEANR